MSRGGDSVLESIHSLLQLVGFLRVFGAIVSGGSLEDSACVVQLRGDHILRYR